MPGSPALRPHSHLTDIAHLTDHGADIDDAAGALLDHGPAACAGVGARQVRGQDVVPVAALMRSIN